MEEVELKHQVILQGNKPDKKLEFWWVVFKDSIKNHVDKHILTKINSISDILNDLQTSKSYELIYTTINIFLETNLTEICQQVIILHSYDALWFLTINIHRWLKINQLFDTNKFEFRLCSLICKYITRSQTKTDDLFKQIISLIQLKRSSIENKEFELRKFESIFKFSIENNLVASVDEFKNYVDIKKYLKDGVDYRRHVNTKGPKLMKILKNEFHE